MTASSPRRDKTVILVVEDDRSLREGIALNLERDGYEVVTAADGDAGMDLAFGRRPDLVVLDIMLPGWSGLDILEELRKRGDDVPVLILSARNTTPDKVVGLKMGADDYLAKPFDLPELMARVDAMLRRRHTEEERLPPIAFGQVEIERGARRVRVKGREVRLSAREFDLLCLLAGSPGQVFTRDIILEQIWGWDYEGTARTVDNFVASLRRKLGSRHRPCKQIRTVPRVGYKLEIED